MYKFTLDKEQVEKLNEWQKKIFKKAYEIQVTNGSSDIFSNEESPNYGSIGGGMKFSFIPTSIGTIVTVKESITGEEIDLTDYDNW
jgi:hypothetical protein